MGLLSRVTHLFAPRRPDAASSQIPHMVAPGGGATPGAEPIVGVRPPGPGDLRLVYAAQPDGRPDAGEVVWGWVPYEEDPSRGKDRPLLLIAPAGDGRLYAMKLTSRAPDGGEDHLALGAGPWDLSGRESWLDVDRTYLVPPESVRREGAALAPEAFADVADALARRFGWIVGS